MQLSLLQAAAILSFVVGGNAQVGPWQQCGGGSVTPTDCVSGYCCKVQNEWYHQCLPNGQCDGGNTSSTTVGPSSTTSSAGDTCPTATVTITSSGDCTATTTVTVTIGGGTTTTTTPITTPSTTTTSSKTTTPLTTTTTTGGQTSGTASVDKLEGYGAGTLGGGSGSGTTVSSCSALSSALSSGGVIKVGGMLSGCGILKVKSSTSIIGVGSNSGMTKGGLQLKGISDVIIRNMKFHSASSGADLVALDTTSKVWIDHCEFYNYGLTGGKDDVDGLLDITHGCDYITVSWCKFHDHWKGSLIGHSDSNGSEDTGKFRVTFHHNYWYNVNSRLPSLRFGTGHIYSSCFVDCPTSGINSRMGAKVLVENNSFTNVALAIVTDLDSDEEGSAQSINNLFLGSTTTRITKTASFSPGYSYTLDPASSVCSITIANAGVGIIG